jgi:protein disulfide-isomerase
MKGILNIWVWITLIAVSAAPTSIEGPVTLKTSNFEQTVASGTWWVDFFSPYCPHCTQLAPAWAATHQELVKQEAAEKYNFNMAKVDCVEDGDLCDKLDILYYPTLQLFRDGKYVETFTEVDRSKVKLLEYAEANFHGNSTATTPSRTFPEYPGSTEVVNTNYPSSPKPSEESIVVDDSKPNPSGLSVDLDHTSFTRKITTRQDPWFVKFYSPRCPHCNEMAPAWTQLARSMRGQLNIGEVNCDIQRELCKDAKIDAYPSLFYFSGTTKIPYNSLRGYGDLWSFANGALAARNIQEIDDKGLEDLMLKPADLTPYVYFYDETTVSEDFEALRRVSLATIPNGRIFKSKSKKLIDKMKVVQFPSLYAVTDSERWVQYPSKSPKEIRDHDRMVNWIKEAWISLVPQMTPMNAKEIFDHAQYVVLALVDARDPSRKARAITEMKASALKYLDDIKKEYQEELMDLRAKKQLKIDEAVDIGDERAEEHAKEIRIKVTPKPVVGFAWIDAVFWQRWLRNRYGFESIDNTVVVINHQSGGKYWDTNGGGGHIEASRSQLVDTIEAVLESRIKPKILITGLGSYIFIVRERMIEHWFATTVVVVGLLALYKRRIRGHTQLSLPLHQQTQPGKLD